MCKNCDKEYNDRDNYQWSCRTHIGEYSNDEMIWWCCGKTGKDAKGCKQSAHEPKLDDEEDDENENKDDNQAMKQNVRCTCCKEIGHSVDDCTRDPNLKTKASAESEFLRIQRMKDFRKLFAESTL